MLYFIGVDPKRIQLVGPSSIKTFLFTGVVKPGEEVGELDRLTCGDLLTDPFQEPPQPGIFAIQADPLRMIFYYLIKELNACNIHRNIWVLNYSFLILN